MAFNLEAEIAKHQQEQRALVEAHTAKQSLEEANETARIVRGFRDHLDRLFSVPVQEALGGFSIQFRRVGDNGNYSVSAQFIFDGLTCTIARWGDDAALTCDACPGWRGIVIGVNPEQTLVAELAFLREWNRQRIEKHQVHSTISEEISNSIAAAEQVLWQWPLGKVLRLWRWQWCMLPGESTYEHHTWSTQRFLYSGVLNDVFKRVLNIEHALPVGEFHEFTSLEDFPSEMKEDVKLSIPGICWVTDELLGYSSASNECYTVIVGQQPVAWVRDLLAKQEVPTPPQS